MELRSFCHLHYIHATKGGVLTKVLNINRGKPEVVFKKLTDIYRSIDDKAQEPLPTRGSREGLGENILHGLEFKVETQVPYAERKLFNDEPEVSDSHSKGDSDGQESDLEVDSMTLKQIMEGCKKRKLSQSRSVDSSEEKLRTCSKRELNQSCLLPEEDDSDLNVALSIWKSKLSKRRKLKTKCEESRISISSQCVQTVGNSDPINSDQGLLPNFQNTDCLREESRISTSSQCVQTIGNSGPINSDQGLLSSGSDLPLPTVVKVETPETDVAEIQNTNYVDTWSLFCDENINLCLSYDHVGPDDLNLDIGSTTSEKEAEYCVLNSAWYEGLEGNEPETLQRVGESSADWMNEDKLKVHKSHHSDFSASESMKGQHTPSYVSNYSMSEAIPLTKEQCSGTYTSLNNSITNEVICQNNSEGTSEAIALTEEKCCDAYISEGEPFAHEATCLNNGEGFTHLHAMTNLNGLQVPEMSPGAEVCLTENSYKDGLAFDHERSIPTESTSDSNSSPDHGKCISTNSISDRNSGSDQHLIFVDECTAKERQPQISDYSDSERITSPDSHLDGSVDKFNQFEEPKRHPTRLLSTRTTISPISQERLSKAMKSMRLHDKECKTCGAKPYFKQNKYKVGTAEECDQMKPVYSDIYQEQNIRKSKKRSSHSASTTKVPQATVQNCSESAIAFTQRQMQDIECLALKLTNQLKSMKAIVEDRLHVEGNKATSFKFNTDEVRTAIADATKAEMRAKKWLLIMSRDCNRFCKIMNTTEQNSNASPTAIQKVKRKVTFADEAGGKLCEVRLIEDDVNAESFVEMRPENCETV
ncbi:uncharacterized protein LOC120076846 [Benincasa hispida]|uniref:uncharacterized protein LOC120076846 n=1 Tax=Benincasa hispida TaxID=102211 RepID=UPI001901C1BF|nr:uncharacterized protein LOC120076846 [Benincasa hispida]